MIRLDLFLGEIIELWEAIKHDVGYRIKVARVADKVKYFYIMSCEHTSSMMETNKDSLWTT
jgi:hypothetical protein